MQGREHFGGVIDEHSPLTPGRRGFDQQVEQRTFLRPQALFESRAQCFLRPAEKNFDAVQTSAQFFGGPLFFCFRLRRGFCAGPIRPQRV